MTPTKAMLCLVLVCLQATGCEKLGDGVDFVNKTSQKLYAFDHLIRPHGGTWRWPAADCSDYDLQILDKHGRVFVELTEEWCAGQTWTITGEDNISLTGE